MGRIEWTDDFWFSWYLYLLVVYEYNGVRADSLKVNPFTFHVLRLFDHFDHQVIRNSLTCFLLRKQLQHFFRHPKKILVQYPSIVADLHAFYGYFWHFRRLLLYNIQLLFGYWWYIVDIASVLSLLCLQNNRFHYPCTKKVLSEVF